jgi:hypothetical protein
MINERQITKWIFVEGTKIERCRRKYVHVVRHEKDGNKGSVKIALNFTLGQCHTDVSAYK